jgi:uncharacterized damage-inducible protein DinB
MTIPETFRAYQVRRITRSEQDIAACLARLTDAQILHRSGDYENSIANLLLHLSGNMRQWFLHGIDNQPDVRTRDEEFSLHPVLPVAEIRARFATTLDECRTVIAALPDDRLLTIIDPQPGAGWPPMTILEAIMQVVGHLQLHTGQIILLTKQLTATDLDLTLPRKR